MVNKIIVVQMEGFWRVSKADGSAVWHEWKWGWNAGGWGSKSYFESTCGATNAMEVCRSSAISCPSFASPPESELAPPVSTVSQKHQQRRHPHAAQRDVGQHASSPATSPLGRRVHASRNHPAEKTPCSTIPIQSASLSQAAHEQLVDVLQAACPAARRRRACSLRFSPTSPTPASCAARRWAARTDAGHISRGSMVFCEPNPPALVLHTTVTTQIAVRWCSRCDFDANPPPSCRGSDQAPMSTSSTHALDPRILGGHALSA